MPWKKLGLVFCPENNAPWMVSHAVNPIAEQIQDDQYRIYFSSRDIKNRSSIGFVEIDINSPNKILRVSENPVVSPGELGSHDYDGVSIACIVSAEDKKYLYYLGWCLCQSVPWSNTIGLAISLENTDYTKYSQAPLLGRDAVDPISTSYPWVIYEDGKWKMWYGTHLKWNDLTKIDLFDHVIKYAESDDGIHWNKSNHIAINIDKVNGEYAISKPCVLKEDGIWKMWYSYRGVKYKIGYAESTNGIDWVRKDELVGITISQEGWDSESIEYPFVFKHKDKKYMLYNGNDYGKTGFGIAVWEDA